MLIYLDHARHARQGAGARVMKSIAAPIIAGMISSTMLTLVMSIFARPLPAQTDYYNTDRGRPLQIEDAYTTERYAFELKLASVRLERVNGGQYNWDVEPE